MVCDAGEETGLLFQLKRFSLHDGPGIRTTVFMKGCPLSCEWCHNPEGQSPGRELMVYPHRCISCGSCGEVCPSGAVVSCTETDRSLCTSCGSCAEACFSGARMLAGIEMSAREVIAEASRDLPFFDDSGGGITFSGGEPMAQPEFLHGMLAICRETRIHTCVDTCGYCDWRLLERTAGLADSFLYDLKIMNDLAHMESTGVSNAPILDNLSRLCDIHGDVTVRLALIPGRTDSADNTRAVEAFVRGLPGGRRVETLPYHDTWRGKLYRLGR